ncbi:MAG: manganese efflux pump [Bacteroidaceae bacterium]|nr:manganese efflux pump [Bacteroidaceae bacterium]
MSILDLILLSVALAMDCFTVSITSGLIQRRLVLRTMLITALMFGLFQALMPMIGWIGISFFSNALERWDHWIAFGLLAFLGGRMVLSGFRADDDEPTFDPTKFSTTLTMAVATSIDALAVGLSFGVSGYNTFASILLPIIIIGIGSFLFSVAGFVIGAYAGKRINFPVEIIGGIILIGIGIKILIEHLAA